MVSSNSVIGVFGANGFIGRAVVRDLHLFDDTATIRGRYDRRYLPGQALYRDDAKPQEVADVLVDNSDWSDPMVLRWPSDR